MPQGCGLNKGLKMNILKFKTKIITRFASGTLLALDAKQVDRRKHMLDETDTKGVYLTKLPVEFKVGETIGVDPDTLGKALLNNMDDFGRQAEAEAKTKEEAATRAEAEAEAKTKEEQKKGPGRPKGSGNK